MGACILHTHEFHGEGSPGRWSAFNTTAAQPRSLAHEKGWSLRACQSGSQQSLEGILVRKKTPRDLLFPSTASCVPLPLKLVAGLEPVE